MHQVEGVYASPQERRDSNLFSWGGGRSYAVREIQAVVAARDLSKCRFQALHFRSDQQRYRVLPLRLTMKADGYSEITFLSAQTSGSVRTLSSWNARSKIRPRWWHRSHTVTNLQTRKTSRGIIYLEDWITHWYDCNGSLHFT
jgi:hypothetical protein